MNSLKFFIVFHNKVTDPCTELTRDEKCNMLRWVAVNKKIPKHIDDSIPTECIINEWDLYQHNPFLQMNNMNENSVIQHFINNPQLYNDAKYIGLGQYDMKLDATVFRNLVDTIKNDNTVDAYFPFMYHIYHLYNRFPPKFWTDNFIEHYNKKFNTTHTLDELCRHGFIPLINCFVIPVQIWKDLVEFSVFITPYILQGLEWDIQHLGGTMERVHGLYLLCLINERKIENVYELPGILHH